MSLSLMLVNSKKYEVYAKRMCTVLEGGMPLTMGCTENQILYKILKVELVRLGCLAKFVVS